MTRASLKVRTGLKAGGVDVQHNRRTLRLLAAADRRIESRERLLREWRVGK